MAVEDPLLNRRERKSRRTRREIVRAASELVIEEGYERATITRIAQRADLATRTVTTRFPAKEEIFFEGIEEAVGRAERHLGEGPGDPIERLRAWIGEEEQRAEATPEDPEVRRLRTRAIARDPDLRALLVHHFDRAHDAIAQAVAADTGQAANAAGPQMIAAAAITLLRVVERLAAEEVDQAGLELERGFRLLQAMMAALAAETA
jgi:AcrR family transcriptional regulator